MDKCMDILILMEDHYGEFLEEAPCILGWIVAQ